MKTLLEIRQQLAAGNFDFSRHAFRRAIERDISETEIRAAGALAEVIENYPQDKYSPSALLGVQLDTGLKSWAGEPPALLWRRSRQQRRTARPACPGKGEIPFTVRP